MPQFSLNSTRFSHLFVVTIVLMTFVYSPIHSAVDVSLTTNPDRVIVNPADGTGIVQEYHSLPLKSGMNAISFSWSNTTIDPQSISLNVPDSVDGAKLDRTILKTEAQTLTWNIYSSEPQTPEVRLQYEVEGFEKEISYKAYLDQKSTKFSWEEQHEVSNRSGIDFEDCWIDLGHGNVVKSNWENNERKQFSVYKIDNANYERIVKVRSTERKNSSTNRPDQPDRSTPVFVKFNNSAAQGLGDKLLTKGAVRLYSRSNADGPVFLGEDRLETVPVGDTALLRVGETKDIEAKRSVIQENRINIVRDDAGNIQLFDRETVIRYELTNYSSDSVSVEIEETMQGEWTLTSVSRNYRKESNELLVVPVKLQPGATVTITMKYVQENVRSDPR